MQYRVTASISIVTTIDPDGYFEDGSGGIAGIEDMEDQSSWDSESYTDRGGEVVLKVEAETEGEARSMAESFLGSIMFIGSRSDLEWEVDDWTIEEIETITPPMDRERAAELIRAFLGRMDMTDEERAAFDFVLDLLTP